MNVVETGIPGVRIIEPDVFGDNRGWFCETYNAERYRKAGIDDVFLQDNESFSSKGVVRGLHWQAPPHTQAKLIRVVHGAVWDVAVDIRKGSPTFGKHVAVVLSSENRRQLYIPRGFAHGFFVLSDEAISSYKCSDFYYPEDEDGLMWNDPTINVDWFGAAQVAGQSVEPILSEKDKKHPSFDPQKKYFNFDASAWLGD